LTKNLGVPQVQRGNEPLGVNRGGVTDALGWGFIRVNQRHAEGRRGKLGSEVMKPADRIHLGLMMVNGMRGMGLKMERCWVLDDTGLTAFYLASLAHGGLDVPICP
jgi:hypothetical protein